MLPPLATLQDLTDRLPPKVTVAESDVARALTRLADASTLVRRVAGQTWVTSGGSLGVVPADAITITAMCAARVWLNPTGVIQDTTGPFTVRYAETAGEVLYLTETEERTLRSLRGTGGLWTQSTTRCDPSTGTTYASVTNGGEPMPMIAREPF